MYALPQKGLNTDSLGDPYSTVKIFKTLFQDEDYCDIVHYQIIFILRRKIQKNLNTCKIKHLV
jgi:hypothetical protein